MVFKQQTKICKNSEEHDSLLPPGEQKQYYPHSITFKWVCYIQMFVFVQQHLKYSVDLSVEPVSDFYSKYLTFSFAYFTFSLSIFDVVLNFLVLILKHFATQVWEVTEWFSPLYWSLNHQTFVSFWVKSAGCFQDKNFQFASCFIFLGTLWLILKIRDIKTFFYCYV